MSYYGLGINEEWRAEEIARAIGDWRAGKHEPYGSIEQFLRECYLLVEDHALWEIKRLQKEQSK